MPAFAAAVTASINARLHTIIDGRLSINAPLYTNWGGVANRIEWSTNEPCTTPTHYLRLQAGQALMKVRANEAR